MPPACAHRGAAAIPEGSLGPVLRHPATCTDVPSPASYLGGPRLASLVHLPAITLVNYRLLVGVASGCRASFRWGWRLVLGLADPPPVPRFHHPLAAPLVLPAPRASLS